MQSSHTLPLTTVVLCVAAPALSGDATPQQASITYQGHLAFEGAAYDGIVDLRAVRAVVRDNFEIERYQPRHARAWNDRLAAG